MRGTGLQSKLLRWLRQEDIKQFEAILNCDTLLQIHKHFFKGRGSILVVEPALPCTRC